MVHGRLTGQQERQRRAQPERLLDDAPEVAQLLEVVLGDDVAATAADDPADLVLDPEHLLWVVDELRHGPYQRGVGRVRGGGKQDLDMLFLFTSPNYDDRYISKF